MIVGVILERSQSVLQTGLLILKLRDLRCLLLNGTRDSGEHSDDDITSGVSFLDLRAFRFSGLDRSVDFRGSLDVALIRWRVGE